MDQTAPEPVTVDHTAPEQPPLLNWHRGRGHSRTASPRVPTPPRRPGIVGDTDGEVVEVHP